jgi:Fe-S-cluster containining protein
MSRASNSNDPSFPGTAGTSVGERESFTLPCFQCGVCCSVYQVRIDTSEARAIAEHMGLELYDWIGRYCDSRWAGTQSHLIRHERGSCVFLERSRDSKTALCSIYDVRPSSCRNWASGVDKPECREGLRRHWRISVSPGGQLDGPPASLARFRDLIRML